MFDQAFGLPVHVLVIHATVVFIPLTVAASLVYAVVPRWRWLLRWPVLVGAVATLATAYVSKESGEELFSRLGQPEFVLEHRERGELMFWIALGFFVVAVAAVFLLGGPSQLVGGRERAGASRPVQLVVAVLLVVVAVGAGVQVVRTGDAGARAVWESSE